MKLKIKKLFFRILPKNQCCQKRYLILTFQPIQKMNKTNATQAETVPSEVQLIFPSRQRIYISFNIHCWR